MPFIPELRHALQKVQEAALDDRAAQRLWGALLDDALDPLETGALLASLHQRGETREEWVAFLGAVCSRMPAWRPPLDARALVLPAFGLAPGESTLVPLLVTLLRRFGLRVIVHGTLDSSGGSAAASVLRELGVLPCTALAAADDQLARDGIAFVPTALLVPPLAALLALRGRLGFESLAHAVVQALPVAGDTGVRVALSVCGTSTGGLMAHVNDAPGDVLTFAWGQRQSPLHPSLRPRIARHRQGAEELLFSGDAVAARPGEVALPSDAAGIAQWIGHIAAGTLPVPIPVLAMLAACHYAAGQAGDIAHAKALAAFNAGRLAA
jgi:anthranilate phosphoribosyltransferase